MALTYLHKDILADLGLDKLSIEEQEKTLEKLGQILFQRVMLRVMDELSDSDQGELSKVLDKKEEEAVWTFLKSKLSNLDDIVAEEINGFKKEASELMLSVGAQN